MYTVHQNKTMLHLSGCKLLITNKVEMCLLLRQCTSINIQKRILEQLSTSSRQWLTFLPAILWAVFIFGLSAMPAVNLPEEWFDLFSIDKLAHAFVYGVLTLLLLRAYFLQSKWTTRTTIQSVLIASVFGILMEIMQYTFFPNRYFEFLDIIANIGGSIVSLFFTRYLLK